MTENLLALYRRAADLAEGIVGRVRRDQLGDPTPCTEWSVRALINHVVTGNLFFVHLATGSPPPGRGSDHLGDDPVAAFRDSVRAVSAAFEADGFLDRVMHAPFGEASGRMLIDMRRNELTVHGWDVAKATGQSTDLDRELVAACLASYAASPRLKNREGGPFGVEQHAPPDATDADRLAAFLGRTV
jgi:uncharacterized protein (TIGR03086 family)